MQTRSPLPLLPRQIFRSLGICLILSCGPAAAKSVHGGFFNEPWQ